MTNEQATEIEVGSHWYKLDFPREKFEVRAFNGETVVCRETYSGRIGTYSHKAWLRLYAPIPPDTDHVAEEIPVSDDNYQEALRLLAAACEERDDDMWMGSTAELAKIRAYLALTDEVRALREQGIRQTVFQPHERPSGGFPANPPRDTGGQQR